MSKQSSSKKSQDKVLKTGKKILGIMGWILIELFEQCEDANFLRSHPWAGFSQSIRADREEYRLRNERRYEMSNRQAIKRLKEAKYVKEYKQGERVIYKLTTSGKVRALRSIFKKTKLVGDNKFCLVSYDFPEAANIARDNFRYFLKTSGFKYVQGSVWSTTRDVRRPLYALIKYLRIKKWVRVYIVSK